VFPGVTEHLGDTTWRRHIPEKHCQFFIFPHDQEIILSGEAVRPILSIQMILLILLDFSRGQLAGGWIPMSMTMPCHYSTRNLQRSRALARLGLVGLLAVVLLSSGCNSMNDCEWIRNGFKVGPNYSRPPAAVAPEWIEAKDPRLQTAPPRDGDWWSVFQDPLLNSLICRAYQQNPNLRAIGTRVLQARSQQLIAFGNLFPQSQTLSGISDNGTAFGSNTYVATSTFNLSWELDFWGKYRRQLESANANAQATVDNYDDALVTLLADVATNYVQYRIAQQRIEIAKYNLSVQERLLSLSEQQTKVGTGTTLDVEQFRSLVEQTRSTIPALQITLGQAGDRLCILLGDPPHDLSGELGPWPKFGGLPMPKLPSSVAVGIPADLLLRRPDVRSAERQVAAQSPQIGVAKSDFYPSLSIGTMLGYADLSLPVVYATQGFLALFTPQFNWKILNYGRIANNVRLQEHKTDEAIFNYQYKVLTAAQEVQTALRGFLLSQDQTEHLARGAEAATKATQVEEKLFTSIKADVNRLYTLENAQLQVQDQLAVAQGNIALNLINVYRALGGGWEIKQGTCGNCTPPNADNTTPNPAAPGVAPTPIPAPKSLPQ
jgi:NodT family efflux transporter outer membrane factor (OMF) lipoprotein